MLAEGPRFQYRDVDVTVAVVDVDATRMARARSPSLEPAIAPKDACVRVEFAFPKVDPVLARPSRAAWETGPRTKEEEFARAVALGLHDYLRKSRSRGFVLSLSGGADSAAIACLISFMVSTGSSELGVPGLAHRLSHIEGLGGARTPRDLTRRLLTCVYQATRNSSETTRAAARRVAEGVGAEHLELDVDRLVQGYVGIVEAAIGRELSWDEDDVALQNIQARARAPSAWLLANVKGALLVATSNRSEAAVGYATMDGDTCGGLAPIAGVDKAFLREWLRWMEGEGPSGLGAFPFLSAVNAQQPTAELRPGNEQTDEADLMPYDVLNAIEQAVIRDKLSAVEAWQLVTARFLQHGPGRVAEWVERFLRLWCRNQWKRERYAPSFHLDDENLDPKTWCRFPILSGGFEREIADLRAAAGRRG